MRRIIALAVLAISLLLPSAAMAFDWGVVAHVTVVEGTYMPAFVYFELDSAAGSCPANQWIRYIPGSSDPTSNANAIYALLLTAKVSGQNVAISGTNSGCVANFVHLGNQ